MNSKKTLAGATTLVYLGAAISAQSHGEIGDARDKSDTARSAFNVATGGTPATAFGNFVQWQMVASEDVEIMDVDAEKAGQVNLVANPVGE